MMEHEQINDKSVALSVRGTKMTARLLAKAMMAFLKMSKKPHIKKGEQSLKSLAKQGAKLEDIEISGNNIGTFKKIARKYDIDFALKQDKSAGYPPRWMVFFKAKDEGVFAKAFSEYAKAAIPKAKTTDGSLSDKLEKSKDLAKSPPEKAREHIKHVADMAR